MKSLRLFAAGLLLGTFSLGAHAQGIDSGIYLGGGGGGVKYNGFNRLCRDITGSLPGIEVDVNCNTDESVFGWKLFGGYRVNPYFAIEAGYANLGEGGGQTEIFGQDVNGEISASALFAELVGSVPLGERARAFGKLGMANLSAELSADVFAVPLASGSFSKSYTEAVFGAGLEFGFSEKVMGRLEWERFDFEDGIDFYTASILFYPGK